MDHLWSSAASCPATTPPPSTTCQLAFLLCALPILALHLLPREARGRLMDYGPRRSNPAPAPAPQQKPERASSSSGPLSRFLNRLATRGEVPHAWFYHFYVFSTGLSIFWAWQFLGRGPVMRFLAEKQRGAFPGGGASADLGSVVVAWGMLAAQGGRRLAECLVVSRSGGTSPMLFVHWGVGMVFYGGMSVGVWVEGCGAILESWHSPTRPVLLTTRVQLALAVFLAAWVKQNGCHRYLAGLNKYTLPEEGLFEYIVCPHYTCECVIYLAIAVVAAPSGRLFNRSVLCGLVFVVVNLGATASGTKRWYAAKFGVDKVAHRWRMVPGIF